VLANPSRDIGWRIHDALLRRTVPGKLNMGLVAIGRGRDRANGDDEFDQIHVP